MDKQQCNTFYNIFNQCSKANTRIKIIHYIQLRRITKKKYKKNLNLNYFSINLFKYTDFDFKVTIWLYSGQKKSVRVFYDVLPPNANG